MPVSAARAAAFDILLHVEQEDAYASELLHSSRYAKLSATDHGLTTEIVMGVLRWRSLLDSELTRFSSLKLAKLDVEVLVSLRMAVFQLFMLDRVPAHAAVHESVELVKRARKRSAVPFVNALLRKVTSHTEWIHDLQKALADLEEAAKAESGVQATVVIPPQPLSPERLKHLADRYAHPFWLVERWERVFGWEKVRRILRYDQEVPVTAIRLPSPADEAALAKAGVILLNGELLKSAGRVDSGDLTRTETYQAGRIAIQDEASQLVALLVGKGQRILDCCAAPGGKTRVIADANPDAAIVATELHPHRARLLRKLVPATNVEVLTADIRHLPVTAPFDRILVDVSCSGTGTLARNPEIKWRLKPEALAELHQQQLEILRSAMKQAAPGARLVYSTCSLEREENEGVIEKALSDDAGFCLIDCHSELERLRSEGQLAWSDLDSLTAGPYLRTVPGVHPCDGFFAAVLEKIG